MIFPGFAWSNLKSQQRVAPERALSRHVTNAPFAPQNQIPRLGGELFWSQAYFTTRLGTSAFIAMFDEFDEATAIAKAAENRRQIPPDQYFLTLDADGVRVSADFYLRLAGRGDSDDRRDEAPHRSDPHRAHAGPRRPGQGYSDRARLPRPPRP